MKSFQLSIKKVLFTIILLFTVQSSYCQSEARAFINMQAYIQNDYNFIPDVSVIRRTVQDIKMNGGNDFKVISTNRSVSKDIRKRYWAVQCNGNLMLNMKMLKSTGHAMALFRSSKHILFKATKGIQYDATTMLLGGAIAGAISGSKQSVSRSDFVLDLQTGKFILLTKKGGGLRDILASNKVLQDKYINAGMPVGVDSYIAYLDELDSEIK